METKGDCISTHDGDLGFCLHLWRCASRPGPQSGAIIAHSLDRCSSTGTSPPMEMNCNCCSTDSDDFAFRLHLWRCSSVAGPQSSTIIALSFDGRSCTFPSPPIDMNCNCCFTEGHNFAFRLRQWRCSSDAPAP